MSEPDSKVVDFLIKLAEDPAKFEEFKIDPNRVLSTFDFPDDVKSDILSGKLENIRRHTPEYKPKHPTISYSMVLD